MPQLNHEITIRLDNQGMDYLTRIARHEGVPIGRIARRAVEEWVTDRVRTQNITKPRAQSQRGKDHPPALRGLYPIKSGRYRVDVFMPAMREPRLPPLQVYLGLCDTPAEGQAMRTAARAVAESPELVTIRKTGAVGSHALIADRMRAAAREAQEAYQEDLPAELLEVLS